MKKIIQYALLMLPFFSQAQNLKASLDKVKGYVKEIKLEKSTVNQQLSYNDASPFDVKIVITNTDSKGKSTEEIYEFDLGLMGDVKRSASSKEMKVELASQKSQKVIKYTKGGEMQNYENKIELLSENIDDARELEKNLKDAISAAKTAWESSIKLPKDDLGGLQTWLEQNIKEVSVEKETFKQSYKKATNYKDRATFTVEENDGKKTTETQSDFSWGDLSEGSELKISGKQVYVSAKAKNNYIKNQQGGNLKGYDDELKFYAPNPTDGTVLFMAIQKMIPIAKKELQARIPKYNSKEEGFKVLKEKIKDFKVNESNYSLKIEPNCLSTYSQKSEIKGKTIEESYKFNFADLADYKLSVSKDLIKITSKVIEGKKYIQYTKDGALQNYENNVDFFISDLEDARYLAEAFPAISKGCKTTVSAGDFNWLVSKLKTIENPKQTLELQEGNDKCKWKFTSSISDSKKSVESIFELNLYDIDPKKIEIDVSGKTVGVTAFTLNKEKFIKLTKEGKPSFAAELNLITNDIEDAQKALATMKTLVEGCKK